MDFGVDETHKQIREFIKGFAQKELAPGAHQRDEEERFDRSLFDKMSKLGITGIPYPQEYGGAEMDYLANVMAIEEISKVDASVGADLSIHSSLTSWVLSEFSTVAQKRHYLQPLAEGQWLGAFSLTESSAGSDAANIRVTAVREQGGYILNGGKVFTSNGGVADIYVVFAVTNANAENERMSAFIVEKDWPGFTIGRPEQKLGIRAHTVAALNFEDCHVPEENLLGEEGHGLAIAMRGLEGGRLGMSAQALGIAESAFEHARDYAKSRIQFGKPIAEFQSVQFKLAEMAVKLETARLLVYKAAWLQSQGVPFALQSAMAKAYVSTIAVEVANESIQIFGGYGFIRDYPVERLLRDARICQIYTGTVEMQLIKIASDVLK
ncbi:acyl-CoA dehydrogenase [Alicyclobacillaceae bacterium I2511]|nr:acyl-CoA dehydrogenase [Alicyclobacillaceae bacterium I2511]